MCVLCVTVPPAVVGRRPFGMGNRRSFHPKLPANSPRPTSSASHGDGLEALDLEEDTRCTSSVPLFHLLLIAGQTPTTPVE
jgi:hypothetical protein